jgi:hypothetical protein
VCPSARYVSIGSRFGSRILTKCTRAHHASAVTMPQSIKIGVNAIDMSITVNKITLSQQHHQWNTLDRLSETTVHKEAMGETDSLDLDKAQRQLDACGALHNFLAAYNDKLGWYYPILGNVNEAGNRNMSFLTAMGFATETQEKGLELLASCGVITFKEPHGGYQVQRDGSSLFLQPSAVRDVQFCSDQQSKGFRKTDLVWSHRWPSHLI